MEIDLSQAVRDILAYYNTSAPLDGSEPTVLIACMPKSASQRLLGMIAAHPALTHAPLADSPNNYDEKIDTLKLILLKRQSIVCHHHIYCSQTLPLLLQRFSLTTVVLVRDIFDAIVSARDHLDQNRHFAHIALKPAGFDEWPRSRQYDFVIDTIAPWYVKFYVSWKRCPPALAQTLVWTDYDEVVQDPAPLLARVFEQAGIDAPDALIDDMIAAADRHRPNFNVGKSKRGSSELSAVQRQRVIDLCRYYDDVDFRPLGIAADAPRTF